MTIRDFVIKWQPILTHWNGAAEDPLFADDCRTCGFEMDRGESLIAAFPGKEVLRANVLREVIATVDNSKFLGTAIFSYWRYLTHWHEAPLPEDAIEWFSIAFDRLKKLASEGK
ncbi:MAG: hypothetical protein PHO45_07900 [Victivallaceae bacterium]|nr:hypothetical protein [Victivallaceae bacterium]